MERTTILPERPADPDVNTPERPDRELPAPSPERRRFIPPTFIKAALIALLFAGASTGFAQTTPNTTPTPAPTTPVPPAAPAMATPPAQPPNQGWVMFDDGVASTLGVNKDQMTRLTELDRSYHDRYTNLGPEPWMNTNYGPLTEQRNMEIGRILTPAQYSTWQEKYSVGRSVTTPTQPGPPNN
jgi:hypothetical protein